MANFLSSCFLTSSMIVGGFLFQPALAGETDWRLSFSTYSWLPWIAGDLGVAQRDLNVDVNPGDVLKALDWSSGQIPQTLAKLAPRASILLLVSATGGRTSR